jgi:hypothetical protein
MMRALGVISGGRISLRDEEQGGDKPRRTARVTKPPRAERLIYTTKPLIDQRQKTVVRPVLFDPRCFVVVDRLRAVLVVRFAERDRLEVARLPLSVSVTNDVVRVRWSGLAADDAGQGLDAGKMCPRLLRASFRLRFFEPERSSAR